MNTPRPNRNPQSMRTLIQDMGRSIDEARTRRLAPSSTSPQSSGGGAADIRIGVASPASSATPAAAQSAPSTANAPTQSSFPAPPVRAATEMFSEGGPRLKARPKNAS